MRAKVGCGHEERPLSARSPRMAVQLDRQSQVLRRNMRALPSDAVGEILKAQIESTSKCNLACQSCFRNWMSRPAETMTPYTLQCALELCKLMEVESVALHGWGEPAMAGDFLFYALRMAKYAGLKAEFTSNGTFATPEWIDRLIEAKPWRVQFSLDVFHQADPAAAKAKENILAAVPRLQDAGVECAVRTVISEKSDGLIEGIPQEWLVLPQRFMIFDFDRPQRDKICPIPGTTLMIWANGDIAPCCSDVDGVLLKVNVVKDDHLIIKHRLDTFASNMEKSKWPFLCSVCHEYDGTAKMKSGQDVPFKLVQVR